MSCVLVRGELVGVPGRDKGPEVSKFHRRRNLVLAGTVAAVSLPVLVVGALWMPAGLRHHAQTLGEPQQVVPRVLYRSSQPRAPIADRLRRHGIATVVDLRTLEEDPAALAEERHECQTAGARFVHLPSLTRTPTDEQVGEFLRMARTPACQPVLVHCEHGKTRAGMMVAAFRIVVDGWSVDQAVEEMQQYNYSINSTKAPLHRAFLEQTWKDRQRLLAQSAPSTDAMAAARR